VQISPSTVTLDAGGSVTFSASGGSGSYSWSKSGDGNLNLVSHIYTALWSAGTATVTVIDAKTPGTAVAAITVNPPAPLVIRQSSTSIYDTGSVTFTASGGSGNPANYSYSMASGPGTGSVVGFKYTPPLGFTGDAVIQVSDVFTLQTSDATVHVTVPVGLAISPKAITIDAGSSLNFTAVAGTAPYSYTKLSGSGTFLDNHDGTATYTAPWATTDAVIQVTESGPKTDDATVTVNLPHLVISPGTTTLNVGQSVTFTGSGGSGNPFNYSYSKLSGSGTFLDNNDGTATYTAPGSATPAVIRLTDSFTHQTRNAIVTVYAPPTLTVTPTTIKVFAGDAVTFTPGGGSGSYSFSRVSGTGTLVGAAYTTIFAETSVIRLTDAITLNTRDATVIACFPLTVIPSSASVQINGTYPFSVSGGVPPYTYSVLFPGNGIIHPSTGLFTAPSGAESDTVKVTDSIANASTASVTVEPPGPWDIVSIDAIAKTGQYASLALDGSGLPRIAYYESQAMELRFATWNGSSWSHQAVDTAGNVGQYCSLALAPGTGYARISYYDSSRHDLKYAKWDGSSWGVPETVDSSGDVGLYTSLALEPGTGYPRISYYDNTSDNLKYASWNGSSWSTQIVDSPGTVGVNTSLALEPGTNYPRISYYKTTSHDLKYAKWDGSSWGVPETVDGVGDVGMYSSLALDAGGNPHISYYDKMYKDLKYASWTGSWVIQVVDNGGDVGMYTSLALEPGTNYPRISYYDNTSGNLKYVSRNSLLVWTIESVDSTNNVGSYSSLKLDPAIPYKPRIAHYDSSSQDLKYAAKR
jgi:plastocyanin